MRRGFTLLETIIVVTISMFLIGGGFVYLNEFNARQKIQAARDGVVSALKLIRNNAMTLQMPSGTSGNLQYIEVKINTNGTVTAWANGDNSLVYFSKKVSPDGYEVDSNPDDFLFSAYDGKLIKSSGGNFVPVGVGETVTITIQQPGDPSDAAKIIINTSGLINEK